MSQSNKVLKEFGAITSFGGSIDKISGSGALGAVSLNTETTIVSTVGGAATGTLADGTEGQKKIIIMAVDGGDYVLTPANYGNGSTLTFSAVGNSAVLIFSTGNWWLVGTPTATSA